MTVRRVLLSVIALCLGASAVTGVQVSGATFNHGSSSDAVVSAADDWTAPVVSVTSPGATISGSTTIGATASDERGTVATVSLQYAPAGDSGWTTLCTDSSSPWSCSWDTTDLADGSYELRAVATDDSGNAAVSATVTTRVANGSVTLTDPGTNLRSWVTLRAAVTDMPAGAKFTFAYAPAGTTSWTTICGPSWWSWLSSTSCTWATPASGSYDVRVVASSQSGFTVTDIVRDVLVDNTVPTGVALTVGASPLNGTVSLGATAEDAHSGIADVTTQYRLTGAGSWSSCGTDTGAPYGCSFDTTSVADGTYELRAVATDRAGNQTASTTLTRTISNVVNEVSITSPVAGATVRGTAVAVTASASSNRGVASVRIDVKQTSTATWMAVCTDTVAPYSCTADTTSVLTGSFDVRAVLVDGNGGVTTSDTVTVQIDNTPPRALDVQAVNSASTGLPSQGDKIVLTYSDVVSPSTIKSGWNGASTTFTPTFYDRAASGSTNTTRDNLSFTGTSLGTVSFAQSYVDYGRGVTFAGSTMVASTQTVNNKPVTVVTVTLGTPSVVSYLNTDTATGAMVWTPTSLVRTSDGLVCSTTPVTESGTSDRDF